MNYLVIAVISTDKHKESIKESLKDYNVIIESYSNKSYQFMQSVLSIDIKYLILSADICQKDKLFKIIENITRKDMQVIIIVESKNDKLNRIKNLSRKNNVKLCYFTKEKSKNLNQLKEALKDKKEEQTKNVKKGQKNIKNKISRKSSRKIIAFLNLTEKAGSTLIASSYADYLAKKSLTPALIEMPFKPDCFYQFGLELFESDKKKFASIPHKIKESSNKDDIEKFFLRNIIWLVSDPRLPKIDNWSVNEMLQLLEHANSADVVILDIGRYMYHESIFNLLPMIDKIFAVIEPRPVNIINSIGTINKFMKYQKYNSRVKVIFNKWEDTLKNYSLRDLVRLKPDMYIPNLSKECLYKSEYNCLSALSEKENRNKLVKTFQDISGYIWPQLSYKTVFNSSYVAEGS